MNAIKWTVVTSLLLVLAGCGGGSSGGSPMTGQGGSPGGIWTGTDSGTGLAVTVLITEAGQAQVIRADGAQYFGNLTVSNTNAISAQLYGIAPYGETFPDGSVHGTGNVSGTLAPRSSAQVSASFTTDKGESTTSSVSLVFQPLYNGTPDVTNFAGTWTDTANGVAVSITSSGAIFAQDPNTGCVINGQVNVVQANYNLWAAEIDYANCQGSAAALNGLQFAGFVELNGNQILAGLQDKSGKNYGLVFSLSK